MAETKTQFSQRQKEKKDRKMTTASRRHRKGQTWSFIFPLNPHPSEALLDHLPAWFFLLTMLFEEIVLT